LKKSIFTFELDGKEVLGFDTGLTSRDFARTKMAQSVLRPGYIIFPDGSVDNWQSGGVTPLGSGTDETIVFWGPLFPGEKLAELIKSDNKDEALDALRFWLKARIVLEERLAKAENEIFYGSSGALIIHKENDLFPYGTVFFPPVDLFMLSTKIEAEIEWLHPDLAGAEEVSFCTGAMLYRVFCGASAFSGAGIEEIHQNIREGVFLPPKLAMPGLDPEMAGLISRLIGKKTLKGESAKRPAPNEILEFVGAPASISKRVSSWLRILDDNETVKINAEKARYIKRNALTVNTRRFVTRNKIIITTSIVVIVIIAFIIHDVIKSRSEDITKGMSPVEVAMTYYNAFGELDHALMENCVRGKAGKEDIDMVINFFVITRVRQAYEIYSDSFIPVQKWLDDGSPVTDKVVFGITDLKISGFSMNEENARLTAEYVLWMPNYNDYNEEDSVQTIGNNPYKDELDFALVKGVWRIESIKRELQLARGP
jgi:hypothetical protein